MDRSITKLCVLSMTIVCAATLTLAQAHKGGRIFHAPDQSYSLWLPAEWEAQTSKDGLGRDRVVIFYRTLDEVLLEIRHLAATSYRSAKEAAAHDEAHNVRFRKGYVKGSITKVKELRRDADVALNKYRYTQDGKPISGRNYYLRFANQRTYLLRFVGRPETVQSLQSQMHAMAQSFCLVSPVGEHDEKPSFANDSSTRF